MHAEQNPTSELKSVSEPHFELARVHLDAFTSPLRLGRESTGETDGLRCSLQSVLLLRDLLRL